MFCGFGYGGCCTWWRLVPHEWPLGSCSCPKCFHNRPPIFNNGDWIPCLECYFSCSDHGEALSSFLGSSNSITSCFVFAVVCVLDRLHINVPFLCYIWNLVESDNWKIISLFGCRWCLIILYVLINKRILIHHHMNFEKLSWMGAATS